MDWTREFLGAVRCSTSRRPWGKSSMLLPCLGEQQLVLSPILDGEAVLYSFETTPEVRIGVAFGSGGSQAGPGTEITGVSTWLVLHGETGVVKFLLYELDSDGVKFNYSSQVVR